MPGMGGVAALRSPPPTTSAASASSGGQPVMHAAISPGQSGLRKTHNGAALLSNCKSGSAESEAKEDRQPAEGLGAAEAKAP